MGHVMQDMELQPERIDGPTIGVSMVEIRVVS